MSESSEVRLARIEEMLRAHMDRDEERAKRWENHEARLQGLEACENRRKGGWVALTTMCGVSGAVGAFMVKILPWATK